MIVPGVPQMASRDSGKWVFVDIGFSQDSKSCGIAIGDSAPHAIHYGDLGPQIAHEVSNGSCPMNLLIEAPLSIAFNAKGCPTGRKIERRDGSTRYWYVGAGAATLLAAMHLLRQLHDMHPAREIRLFEGFASFKSKEEASSHAADVSKLRSVAWGGSDKGRIVCREGLKMWDNDCLNSAFAVSGMDFGVPAVVVLEDQVLAK